jgi:hypothetical protein
MRADPSGRAAPGRSPAGARPTWPGNSGRACEPRFRRLATDNLTFSRILDELRAELAQRYLAEPSLPITQIAWVLASRMSARALDKTDTNGHALRAPSPSHAGPTHPFTVLPSASAPTVTALLAGVWESGLPAARPRIKESALLGRDSSSQGLGARCARGNLER